MFLPLPSRNLPDPIFGMLIVMFDFSFIGYNDPYLVRDYHLELPPLPRMPVESGGLGRDPQT